LTLVPKDSADQLAKKGFPVRRKEGIFQAMRDDLVSRMSGGIQFVKRLKGTGASLPTNVHGNV
jgi:hypothetical protein